MTELVRCPACRGTKKVPKLGGIVGECNTCKGEGSIKAIDKPKPVPVLVVEPVKDVIEQVAQAVPVSVVEEKPKAVKTANGKRAIYKRKQG